MMKELTLAVVLVAASLLAITPANAAPQYSQCDIVPGVVAEVARIRGLTSKGAVPCFEKNKEQVTASLKALIKEKIPDEKLANEGAIYKAIGLIPKDFDYAKGLIELYVSQLGGYYDPSKRYFVMASWIPSALQVPVAAHELTHALQDQHFNLSEFTDPKIENGDTLLARSALIEGDATAAMMDYVRKGLRQPPIAKMDSVAGIMMQNLAGGGFSPSLGKVPQSLQLALYFPYTSGLRFAHELLKRGGYTAIDEAFKRPPVSTSQILHPEKYFDLSYKPVEIDEAALARGCKIEHRDTIGEFVISALLSQHSPDKQAVSKAAAGWSGDRVLITRCADGARRFRWKIAWESAKDLEEFLALYPLNGATVKKVEETIESPNKAVEFEWTA